MIYPFVCPACGAYDEVVRHHTEAAMGYTCRRCGQPMNRVYTIPQINVPERGYFDYGLGVTVKNKDDIKDAIRRIGDGGKRDFWERTEDNRVVKRQIDVPGRQIEEVGSSKVVPKKPRQEYDIPNEVLDKLFTKKP